MSQYEISIETDSNQNELFVLAARFIDVSNKEDLQYVNGVPAANVNVNVKPSSISEEVLTALSNRSTGDDELKDLLKDLIGAMAANASATSDTKEILKGEDGIEMT